MSRLSDNRMALTKTAIDAIKPPKTGRVYVHDTRQAGLALAVTSTGAKSFYVVKKVLGRAVRVRLGSAADLTPEQARKQAAVVLLEFAAGKDPNQAKREARHGVTMQELFDRFLETHAKPRKKTWRSDEWQWKKYCKDAIGSRRASDLKRADVVALHSKIGKDAKTTANRVAAMLSTIFTVAIEQGIVQTNPAAKIKKFREQSRDRFLSQDEMRRFLQHIVADPDPVFRDFVLISLLTGARRSNVQMMKWADIDFSRRLWRVGGAESKSGIPLLVVLTPAAVAILEARRKAQAEAKPPKESEFVFAPTDHRHAGDFYKTIGKFWPRWRALLKRADLTDLRMHDIRRSMASWMTIGGASLPIVGKALGHATAAATQVYARLLLDPVRTAVQTANDTMLGFAEIDVIEAVTGKALVTTNGTSKEAEIIDQADPQADQPQAKPKAGRKPRRKAAAG